MPDSFLKRLTDSFETRSERIAMRVVGDADQVYTFGESLSQILAVSYRLKQAGITKGDRVVVMGENHPAWAIAYLGTLYSGAVCVPIDPHGEIGTIANFFVNSEAKLAFIDAAQVDRLKQIADIPAIVWGTETSVGNHERMSEWTTSPFPDNFAKEPAAAGDDVALLIYTSGTTGTPKGVPLTHGNILAELNGINRVLRLSDKEKMLSLLPLFHAYLQIVNLWVATTYGCEVGYLKELSPAELGNAMREFKPTILTTVPRLWYLFHKKIFDAVEAKSRAVQTLFKTLLAVNALSRDAFGTNLGHKLFGKVHESFGGNLRIAISAGSRFDEDVARDFHRLGFTILQGYGLTETSGAATATYETDNRIGSVGKPMFNAEIKIDNPDKDGVGEVLIRGQMVFSGYYKNPEANAEVFTPDGWFRSGDLGRLGKDGHLYIVGRAKDVIVLPSGRNVHPEDLEVHYLKAPYVEELAIIGVADHSGKHAGAEKLVAVVVPNFEYLKQAKIANSREIIRYTLDDLGRELPEYQRVREYLIRAAPLPRTATRKIKRFELKRLLESGSLNGQVKEEEKSWELSSEDRKLLTSPVGGAITKALRQHMKNDGEIHPDMNLEIDLGLDSLARAEAFAALEHAFSVEFTPDDSADALTVREVADLVSRVAGDSGNAGEVSLNWSHILKDTDGMNAVVGHVLRPRHAFLTFAWLVYKCFNAFCRIFMRLEVTGREHLRAMDEWRTQKGEAFLICPNHQSYIDAFIISSTYPHRVFTNIFHVGTSGIFNGPFMEFVAKMLNVVPVDPDMQLMKAMKAGAIGLRAGKVLNIYPEGERSYDGHLHEFKKGAAILSIELGLPILPVAIDGAHKVWPRGTYRLRPGKVKIRFGEPIFPNSALTNGQRARGSDYAELIGELRSDIAKMIGEMRR
ncbi:MAG: AMP-binding protein [Blastocatellia bacterium]|nr:AMP-binding protein [Blastocatellia bacterium]